MKSIRKDLFVCLQKNGETTMDELVTMLPAWTRGQLSNNVQAARKEGLASSRKDDVTGLPAYRLTEAGKVRLAEILGRAETNAKFAGKGNAKPAETSAPPELRKADADSLSSRQAVLTLQGQLREAQSSVEKWQKKYEAALELASEERIEAVDKISKAETGNQQLEASLAAATRLADDRKAQIAALNLAIEEGKKRIAQLENLNAFESAGNIAAKLENRRPAGYLVARPNKLFRRFTALHSAQAIALAAVRAGSTAEVFALHPVGKAVRGAEWKGR